MYNFDEVSEELEISDLTVLKSNDGFYIGRTCNGDQPYSRESDYFGTEKEALFGMHDCFYRRIAPENNYIYESRESEYIYIAFELYRAAKIIAYP